MTTPAPHRKALADALDAAQRTLPPYDPADLKSVTLHMTVDLQRAMLMPVADMFDRRVGRSDTGHVVANALSNAILSHAMSLADGDKAEAAGEVAHLLAQVKDLLERSFDIPDLDAHTIGSAPVEPTGRAQ